MPLSYERRGWVTIPRLEKVWVICHEILRGTCSIESVHRGLACKRFDVIVYDTSASRPSSARLEASDIHQ